METQQQEARQRLESYFLNKAKVTVTDDEINIRH